MVVDSALCGKVQEEHCCPQLLESEWSEKHSSLAPGATICSPQYRLSDTSEPSHLKILSCPNFSCYISCNHTLINGGFDKKKKKKENLELEFSPRLRRGTVFPGTGREDLTSTPCKVRKKGLLFILEWKQLHSISMLYGPEIKMGSVSSRNGYAERLHQWRHHMVASSLKPGDQRHFKPLCSETTSQLRMGTLTTY